LKTSKHRSLFFTGGNDRTEGFVQGNAFFSLKVLGPVEYVVHQELHKLPEVEITDNEWINCCEPLNSLKGGLIKVKRTSHQLLAYYNLSMMMKITPCRKYFIVP
jgi:hypothetical protein